CRVSSTRRTRPAGEAIQRGPDHVCSLFAPAPADVPPRQPRRPDPGVRALPRVRGERAGPRRLGRPARPALPAGLPPAVGGPPARRPAPDDAVRRLRALTEDDPPRTPTLPESRP